MDILKERLVKMTRSLGRNFTLNARPITLNEIFSAEGLLPAIARRADQLCSLCLGYGIGVSFEETEDALLGQRSTFDDATPNALRLLCILDVMQELINVAPQGDSVSLDELMYD